MSTILVLTVILYVFANFFLNTYFHNFLKRNREILLFFDFDRKESYIDFIFRLVLEQLLARIELLPSLYIPCKNTM